MLGSVVDLVLLHLSSGKHLRFLAAELQLILIQQTWPWNYEYLLLLHVEIWLGFVPDLPRLHRLRLLYLPSSTLLSSCCRFLWTCPRYLTLLLQLRCCFDDVCLLQSS